MFSSLDKCHNIEDLRRVARRVLPSPVFHYMDGGADDEWSLRNNTRAFEQYRLMPRYLRDVSTIDTRKTVLGARLELPLILSPTGMSRLFHHDKEFAVCEAAAEAGLMYGLSTLATSSLESIASHNMGSKMFQIYILKDRELTREFVLRCKDAGYDALCLTVDTPLAGNRERDLRTGMTMPPTFTINSLLSYATSVRWTWQLLRNPDFRLENVAHRVDALGAGAMGLIDYVNSQFDRTVTWDDVAWLAGQWDGPFAIKGLQSPEDVRLARSVGATAVMVSNHGGRQLDATPAPVECIPAIRDAVGDAVEVIVDGGIRRGTHMVKALALGADACSIGRAYLYGLAAGGKDGVSKAIGILRSEFERSMALLGCRSVDELDSQYLEKSYRYQE